MRDGDRLATFEACFQHATHIVVAAFLVAVLIAQVDLHSRDVIPESVQGTLHHAAYLSGQLLVTFDVTVGIDLDLHTVPLRECGCFKIGR